MNKDTLEGQWMQIKGKVRQQWGKLTDDDLDRIQGDIELLYGKVQERYGQARDQAMKEVDAWLSLQEAKQEKSEREKTGLHA